MERICVTNPPERKIFDSIVFIYRQESEEKIWELVQKWIRKNGMFKDTRAKHVILFHLPPRYGYETILRHVHRKSLNKWQVN